ncbi:MAG: ATP-binding protein [Firmicutes bacterium]|nr:ATP-binding protein [Bacillota bacterium]
MENSKIISDGFAILRDTLAPYIGRELGLEYGSNIWWREGVMKTLRDDQKRNLPGEGDFATLTDSLDIARCLLLFDIHWQYVFKKKLSIDHRTWAKELIGFRNRLAHIGGNDFSNDDTWRALDTMSRLCEQLDSESAEEIRGLLRTSRYGSADGSTTVTEASSAPATAARIKKDGILKDTPISGLPSWRDVIEPHPDVAQGRYKNAEFAADLAQVARGEGAYEYRDPVEFFARTYVTEGMTGLLEQALRRVCGKDGEPVIQLKTAFGGGKTHSMLALYHMMRGRVSIGKIPNVKPVLKRAGVTALPKANVAVLVGTALDPTKSKRPNNMPGITINTLWGEMAAQLAESAGKPKLYDYVKESDKKGVSPGSEMLKNLFDAAAPCLILMDELVAYAKKIYGASGLPAGTFDNFISFIQEVTEAARASKNSLVVASIPESDIEIGGEAGKTALTTIEHIFGRMESIWKPVAANEGFEVVRRRLFLDCKNPDGRDEVCARFSHMYNENQSDFPPEAREVEYRGRMISCYPIHPEVFDRLYEDWATLERFQRTRGVLRLMAAVIHELWMGNDASLMIMPGSIPLDVPNVRDELTRHLSEGWNALVDREVDGRNSIPFRKDQANIRYGSRLAARRVARTVMLGSAPTVRDQNVRGIESSRIRLGVVQPGENIANFNDALNTLTSSLAYLYTNPSGDRFWYDTRPTLRKTVEDRATQVSASDVEYEIETRLRSLRKERPFAGVHICPASSLDVPDEQTARLVILRPVDEYKAASRNNNAMTAVADILNNRGSTPRIYRNMLAFIAPDQDRMTSLKQAARLYIAWKSIKDDSEDLNLDAAQNRETENNLKRANETVDAQVKEAYCWLLVPYIDRSADIKTIVWDTIRISGGNESIIQKAAKKMLQNEAIITQWAPALLRMELDGILWRDSDTIAIKKLWEYLCTYCYLPRLANEEVLNQAIQTGLNSTEYFAYASGFDGTRYIDLKFNQYVGIVERSGYLVKVGVAQKQLAEEEAKRRAEAEARSGGGAVIPAGSSGETGSTDHTGPRDESDSGSGSQEVRVDPTPATPKNKRFFMSADLDTMRINRDVQKYVEEIIQHLITVDGARVKVSLEVEAETTNGFTQQIVRTISENCRTLRVRDSGFEE